MRTDREYVLSHAPEANCSGPVKLFWPGQGERMAYVVTLAPHLSRVAGAGDTEVDAWHAAAEGIRRKLEERVTA